jgi:hypothetical protein
VYVDVEKTTILILLDLQLEHNFIDSTGISTTAINTGTGLLLLLLVPL